MERTKNYDPNIVNCISLTSSPFSTTRCHFRCQQKSKMRINVFWHGLRTVTTLQLARGRYFCYYGILLFFAVLLLLVIISCYSKKAAGHSLSLVIYDK